MINTSLDIKQLSEEFAQNKSVQIFDFLKEKDANNLFNWFYDDIPEDWINYYQTMLNLPKSCFYVHRIRKTHEYTLTVRP